MWLQFFQKSGGRSERKFAVTESKFLTTVPKSAILQFCPSRETLLGSAFPKPCSCAPYGRERRSHHAKEIQHAPPQPRCENPGCPKMSMPTSQRGLRPMVSASPNFSGRRYGGRPYARLSMCRRSMTSCFPLSEADSRVRQDRRQTSIRLPGI